MNQPLTLRNMLDDSALLSLEHQLFLEELLGEHSWNVDLGQPSLTFTGDHPLVCRVVHLIGSAAPGPQSWLWSWANTGQFAASVTGLASALSEFGRQNGITELTRAEIPFAELPISDPDAVHTAAQLADAAKVFSGRWFSYTNDAGRGTRVAFLIEHPELRLPGPEPARVMRVIQQGLAECDLADHRRALASYAQYRPLGYQFTPDGRVLTLTGPQLQIDVEFDEQGRAGKIDGHLGADG